MTGREDAVVDHSIHGLVTIRLIDAPTRISTWLEQTLGPSSGTPSTEPDICIRFVPSLEPVGRLHVLGRQDAAFDDEHFYLLDGNGRPLRIDLSAPSGRCEILAPREVESIPLLVPVLGLMLLDRGHVLLHASSFVWRGRGVLVAGWQGGGKTEVLLPFLASGAVYIADEWTILSPEDRTIRGLSGRVQLWEWHFRSLPQYWNRISASDRRRIRLARLYDRLYDAWPGRLPNNTLLGRFLAHVRAQAAHVARAAVSPSALLGPGRQEHVAHLDRVFLALAADGPISVSPIDPQKIARRMVGSLTYERLALLASHSQLCFAFPDRVNKALERAEEQERVLLERALGGTEAYQIVHPNPTDLWALYNNVLPYC